MPSPLKPIGFWSYHRPDGAHSDGRMARLHTLVQGEIRIHAGEPVHIFRDLETIRTGDDWKKEIDDALAEASFMIAIVTPGFLRSEWCCYEVNQFLKREQALGGRKLIFPIEYAYIGAFRNHRRSQVHDESVLSLLDSRQIQSFLDHRHDDPDTPAIRRIVGKLAADVDAALNPAEDTPAAKVSATPKPAPLRPTFPEPEMVHISRGSFWMGATDAEHKREKVPTQWRKEEQPRHKVTIGRDFALGKYPVTRGEFARFVAETGYAVPKPVRILVPGKGWIDSNSHDWRDPGFPQDDQHPVVCVNHIDAESYAAWLSGKTGKTFRLPSEAEWEYACRAGTETARFWGDDRDSARLYANVADASLARALKEKPDPERFFTFDDGFDFTSPVGTFRANPWGLHDMLGNVWEYLADDWIDNYTTGPSNETPRTTTGSDRLRVVRGASWNFNPWFVRSACRSRINDRDSDTGFRLARTL